MSGNSAKFGRGSRSPSSKRYQGEQRWVKNARLRQERHKARVAKHAAHLAKRAERVSQAQPFSK